MGLRIVLAILAVYTGLFGLAYLFAHDLAVAVLGIVVGDPVAFRQWGMTLLMLALLAALLAVNPHRYRLLLLIPLIELPLNSVLLLYEITTGTSGPRQMGVPLAVNLVLFVLLLIFYPRRDAAGAAAANDGDAARPAV